MSHTLAVITVVYENYTILDDYFASFNNQTDKNFHIFVVDTSISKKKVTLPDFASYLPAINKGYAFGVNVGLKEAIKQDFSLFAVTNSDITVQNNFIEKTLASITAHPSSLIGGKIYYAKGYEYHKNRYSESDKGNVLWYTGGINDWANCQTKHRGVDEVDSDIYNTFEKTDFITGCLMCLDKKVLDTVGFWDESYFLYYEDADYCERAKKKHVRLFYDPSIVIFHKNAASTGGSGSSIQIKYQQNNQLKFGLTYAPLKTKLHLLKNYFMRFLNSLCNCGK